MGHSLSFMAHPAAGIGIGSSVQSPDIIRGGILLLDLDFQFLTDSLFKEILHLYLLIPCPFEAPIAVQIRCIT